MTSHHAESNPRREEALRRLLEARRDEIVDRLQDLREIPAPESSASKDREDHAVDNLTRHMAFALAEMTSATLVRIEEAILRLERGAYGVCAECRGDIAEERLAALPFAAFCRACQAEREAGDHALRQESTTPSHSRAI
jgi:DnaK suppressor protein